jgi:hypothetical protein
MPKDKTDGPSQFNDDPAWLDQIERLEPLIRSMARKYAPDKALSEDCAQEARIALISKYPSDIRGYEDYRTGRIAEADWQGRVDRYLGKVIRWRILRYLRSLNTGSWHVGRTRSCRDSDGTVRVQTSPPRHSSLDQLTSRYGLQVDEQGSSHWPVKNPWRPDALFDEQD